MLDHAEQITCIQPFLCDTVDVAGEDAVDDLEHTAVAHRPLDLLAQQGVVDMGKIFLDIALQAIAVALGKLVGASQPGVGALAGAAGVGICNETGIKDRLQHAHEGVVHDASRKGAAATSRSLGSWMVK